MNNNILNLENGTQLKKDRKKWTITETSEYDWGDSKSIEYELESSGEIAFLNIEIDDELFLTFMKEIKDNIEEKDYFTESDGTKIPEKLKYNKETFKLDEISEGVCVNKNTGEGEKIVSFDYFNKKEDKLISYEKDLWNEITIYYGDVIGENEISIL